MQTLMFKMTNGDEVVGQVDGDVTDAVLKVSNPGQLFSIPDKEIPNQMKMGFVPYMPARTSEAILINMRAVSAFSEIDMETGVGKAYAKTFLGQVIETPAEKKIITH